MMSKEVEKEEFLKQYVLNRARCRNDHLSGDSAAREALEAWNFIQKSLKP